MTALSAGYFIIRLLYGCPITRIFYNKVALGLHYHLDIFYKIDPNCSISGVFYNKIAPNCTISGVFYNKIAPNCTISGVFYNKIALWLHYMYQRDILQQGCSMAALHVSAGYFIIRLLYDCTFRGIFYNKAALWLPNHQGIL